MSGGRSGGERTGGAPPRIVVLASGNGSNLQALLDAAADRRLDGDVVAVVSDQSTARALNRAREAEVAAVALPRAEGESRVDYDERLAEAVAGHAPDLVVLAGWMRILTMSFLGRFPVINLHPALPGAFAGTHAIQRAFAAWQAGEIDHSGVMVHWVPDEGVDTGPPIAVTRVDFVDGDSLDSFEERIHRTEHRLLVRAVDLALVELATDSSPVSFRSRNQLQPRNC